MNSPLLDAISSNRQLSDRTRTLYSECVTRFVAFASRRAGTDPARYTCKLVEEWFEDLQEAGLQLQTVGVYRKAIRHASKRYASRERRPELDFAGAATCAKPKRQPPPEPLTYEEAMQLLTTCTGNSVRDQRDYTLMLFALRTGLRRGGLCALDLSGVRPPKIMTINKGGDLITFVADEETLSALAAWIAILHRQRLREGAVFREIGAGDALGDRMTPFQIWDVFRQRAKQAGIRHVHPHLMRHTTVTWLREAGRSAAEVSALTGQSEQTIENIYTHVRPREAVAAALPSFGIGKRPA